MRKYRLELFASLVLIIVTLLVYWPVARYEFINYDDRAYVAENAHIQKGWTGQGAAWAFTTTFHGHWHPLTWLSHMTDCQLFGLDPGRHHLSNLFFHAANALLVFWAFKLLTGALFRSALVALVFSLHPLHVEAVASVASRKDLLSTFFWLLAMVMYAQYVRHKSFTRYGGIFLFFVLGLMSKAMVVTLPVILLVMDYWPLGRLRLSPAAGPGSRAHAGGVTPSAGKDFLLFKIIGEKLFLLLVTGAAGALALFFMQASYDSGLDPKKWWPTAYSLANSLVSYVSYMGKMFWPAELVAIYPFRDMPPAWQSLGAFFLVAGITALAFWKRRTCPYLLAGWLWYLITLLPVIGVISIGPQAMADKYTYLPTIGLSLIIVWGGYDLVRKWRFHAAALSIASCLLVAALGLCSWNQLGYWQNSIKLFERAVRMTGNNPVAHYCLGYSLEDKGMFPRAVEQYGEALRESPGFFQVRQSLGALLLRLGRADEALSHFREALKQRPDSDIAHVNAASALMVLGKQEEASGYFQKALRINPDYEIAHINLGLFFAGMNRLDDAAQHYKEALRINPLSAEAHYNLGGVLYYQNKLPEAIEHYRKALAFNPRLAAAHVNLGVLYEQLKDFNNAVLHYKEALMLSPGLQIARQKLELILSRVQQK